MARRNTPAARASEARRRERKRLEAEAKLRALRETGASCVVCRSYRTKQPFPGWTHGAWCAADSDFHGYAVAQSDGLCLSYSAPAVEG